jgi:hypothetical protein
MKNTFALVLLTLIACTEGDKDSDVNNEKQDKNRDTLGDLVISSIPANVKPWELTRVDPEKIECIPVRYTLQPGYSPAIFSDTAYVYNSVNTGRKPKDTLRFGTPVNILAEVQDNFLICTPKGSSGYVNKNDVSLHLSIGKGGGGYYLIGLSQYGTTDHTSCDKSQLKVVLTGERKQQYDVYLDSILGNEYEIRNLYSTALKDVRTLLYLTYHCYSEIGYSVDHFIVDNGKLSRLILTGNSGDGGVSDITNVYLPTHLTNGKKIVLARNGILSVDERNAKPQLYEYPKDLGIPIEELIVVEQTTEETGFDQEKGELLYNDDGTQAVHISVNRTDFYRWDGSTLRVVKTIEKDGN